MAEERNEIHVPFVTRNAETFHSLCLSIDLRYLDWYYKQSQHVFSVGLITDRPVEIMLCYTDP